MHDLYDMKQAIIPGSPVWEYTSSGVTQATLYLVDVHYESLMIL